MMLPDRFFDDIFDLDAPRMHSPKERMDCDIYEEDGKYVVEASVSGFNKEDIETGIPLTSKDIVDQDDAEDFAYLC